MSDLRSVYVIAAGPELCKIGQSKAPDDRRRYLEKKLKRPLNLIWTSTRTPHSNRAEYLAHGYLAGHATDFQGREWFRVGHEAAIVLVDRAVKRSAEEWRAAQASIAATKVLAEKRRAETRGHAITFRPEGEDLADLAFLEERFPDLGRAGIVRQAFRLFAAQQRKARK